MITEKERLNQLIWKMIDYYEGDALRIQHFTKVYTFANWIAEGENLSDEMRYLISVLALTHDIGIKSSVQKYGHHNHRLQEQEGAIAAHAMLTDLGFEKGLVERVSQIIGRHHTYTGIDGLDCQILIEADFLVNFQEGNVPLTTLPKVDQNIFATQTGKSLLWKMYKTNLSE